MKVIKFLFVSVFLTLFFIGCSSKSASPADIHIKNGKGAIVVYRPHNPIWKHKRFNIYINGNYEDMLMNKSHFIFDKAPGDYVIELREDVDINPDIFKVKLQLKVNKTKYIRFGAYSIEDYLKLKLVKRFVAIDDEWYKQRY